MTYQEKEKKWVQPLTLLQEGSNRILPIVISIVSCSPLSSSDNLKIMLPSYLTCFQVAFQSLQSLPNDSHSAQHSSTHISTQEI